MLGQEFYHQLIKKYSIVFGTLFNDLYIPKIDNNGNIISKSLVPLSYSPREKFFARNEDIKNAENLPAGNRKTTALRLPRMSYEIVDFKYQVDRKQNSTNKIYAGTSNNNNLKKTAYAPVPYDIIFNLYIMTKTQEDMFKIIEQILPYFTPDYTPNVEIIPDVFYDIPIVLDGIEKEDTYEGAIEERRIITATLTFTLKGILLGPVSETKRIKIIDINFYSDTAFKNKFESITIQPGLTPEGNPTTDINETIPYLDINIDDNYDYIVQIKQPDNE